MSGKDGKHMNQSFTKENWLVVSTALKQMLALDIIVSDRVQPDDTHLDSILGGAGQELLMGFNPYNYGILISITRDKRPLQQW